MRSTRPVLGLVHGWGMNARVFDALAGALAAEFDVRVLDLPGHGGRAPLQENTLATWADDVAAHLPDGAALLGWSLGGQVAMRAALDHPRTIARLILLATTPRFVAAPDWSHAMAPYDLAQFGAALVADPRATLLRFLSLQTRGAADQKTLLAALRENLQSMPLPDAQALAAGLAMLRDTDLRAALASLAQPTLVLHGARDMLTPAGAGAALATALRDAQHIEFAHAAHAPHLSHTADVAAAIRSFLHG